MHEWLVSGVYGFPDQDQSGKRIQENQCFSKNFKLDQEKEVLKSRSRNQEFEQKIATFSANGND